MKLSIICLWMNVLAVIAHADSSTGNVVTYNEIPAFTYIPYGFDDNDNVQVMVEGQLPNTCYKVGQPDKEVSIDGAKKTISINNEIVYTPHEMCAQVIVNYQKLIKIGRNIPVGDYEIVYNVGEKTVSQGILNINKANKVAMDDYLYLPVQQAYFLREITGVRPPTMVLTGRYTNTCQHSTENEVQIEKSPRVIAILPKMEISGDDCKNEDRPFEVKIPINGLRSNERYLVHIRSLDGQAVNRIIEVY